MRTVTFQSVLNGVARLLGLDPGRDLNASQSGKLTEYITDRCKEGWKFEFWPEWTVCEQRFYREAYDVTQNILAPTSSQAQERYYIAGQAYYQALRAQSPAINAPATLVNGVYVENSAWWAVCASSYTANDWATGVSYAVGQQVRNPGDGQFYQCYTAHTAGGAFDASKFGILTAFDRYVGYDQSQAGVALTHIDEVKGVYKRNPRVFVRNPMALPFRPSNKGVQLLPTTSAVAAQALGTAGVISPPGVVWVEFRLRPPVFNSTPWSAAVAYGVGDVRYYGTTGECYQAIAAGTGHVPTDGAYWVKVDFPEVLSSWVKRAAFADGLRDQRQTDRAEAQLAEAVAELEEARDRQMEGQGQYERAGVATYGA